MAFGFASLSVANGLMMVVLSITLVVSALACGFPKAQVWLLSLIPSGAVAEPVLFYHVLFFWGSFSPRCWFHHPSLGHWGGLFGCRGTALR